MLFHYHLWTPNVEATEQFYEKLGFAVTQRIGKTDGAFTAFDPPLTWDDFRDDGIRFRIIEMKRGAINVTFGHGKAVRFDHLGFLVTPEQRTLLLERAQQMDWTVQANERRTFIQTPYACRIELQTHHDAILSDGPHLKRLELSTKQVGFEQELKRLFGHAIDEVTTVPGDHTVLQQVIFTGEDREAVDPNGVSVRQTRSPVVADKHF